MYRGLEEILPVERNELLEKGKILETVGRVRVEKSYSTQKLPYVCVEIRGKFR